MKTLSRYILDQYYYDQLTKEERAKVDLILEQDDTAKKQYQLLCQEYEDFQIPFAEISPSKAPVAKQSMSELIMSFLMPKNAKLFYGVSLAIVLGLISLPLLDPIMNTDTATPYIGTKGSNRVIIEPYRPSTDQVIETGEGFQAGDILKLKVNIEQQSFLAIFSIQDNGKVAPVVSEENGGLKLEKSWTSALALDNYPGREKLLFIISKENFELDDLKNTLSELDFNLINSQLDLKLKDYYLHSYLIEK